MKPSRRSFLAAIAVIPFVGRIAKASTPIRVDEVWIDVGAGEIQPVQKINSSAWEPLEPIKAGDEITPEMWRELHRAILERRYCMSRKMPWIDTPPF